MKIVYAIPTANKENSEKCLQAWKSQGYLTAVLVNHDFTLETFDYFFKTHFYKGYPWAVNLMAKCLLDFVDYDILITGGDDIYPDTQHTPEQIGKQFLKHFGGTDGVMQPTGELFGNKDVCGSPWIGRAYIEGVSFKPFCEAYFHFYCDKELYEVAKRSKKLWLTPTFRQEHKHWSRVHGATRPDYLVEAKRQHEFARQVFEGRQLNGFPKWD